MDVRYTEYQRERLHLVVHDFATYKKHRDRREQISIEACDIYSDIQWVVNTKREQSGSQNS